MYDQKDLDLFFTKFASNIPNGTHPILKSIDGGVAPTPNNAGPESVLDFQLSFPLVYPQNINLFQTDDLIIGNKLIYEIGGFDTFLDAVDGVSPSK
jgi:tripeptidyl-peptidase-1